MHFPHIENALNSWKSHKAQAVASGLPGVQIAEVESYVLRCIVLLIVAEYEEFIEKLFVKRAEKSGDSHIHRFFKWYMDKKFRSPDLGTIKGMLGQFGGTYSVTFREAVETVQPQLAASWQSLLIARHTIVHKSNAGVLNLTWQDLETDFVNSQLLLQKIADAFGLTQADLQTL